MTFSKKYFVFAIILVAVLFTPSFASAANVKNLVEPLLFVKSTILNINVDQGTITIDKGRNERSRILFTPSTFFLVIFDNIFNPVKSNNFSVGDEIFAYVGYYPYHSNFYVAGLIGRVGEVRQPAEK